MANVLFVACPESYATALPAGAGAFATGELNGPHGCPLEPDLVVIGPASARPSVTAQRAAKKYPGVDVLIAARSADMTRLSELLKITPYIPLRTDLVSEDSSEALAAAIRQAVARCDRRKGHRQVLGSLRSTLAAKLESRTPLQRRGEASAISVGTVELDPERQRLLQFFQFYERVHREVALEVQEATASLTAPPSPLRPLAEDEAGMSPELVLEAAALVEGDWQPLFESLRVAGRAHAELGLGFGTWLQISHYFRKGILDRLLPEGPRTVPFEGVLMGMERFLTIALGEIERAHAETLTALVRKYEAEAQLFAVAVEFSEDAIFTTALDGTVTAQNPAAARQFGALAEHAGKFGDLAPATSQPALSELLKAVGCGPAIQGFETLLHTREGLAIDVTLTVSPVKDAEGHRVGLSIIARDTSGQKAREASLRQAHKMEALGRLAGGIAHDFNNLLTVILAHASFLLEDSKESDSGRVNTTEIIEAAERARALTHQLLAFSRRQPLQPRAVSASEAVRTTHKLLRRTFPSDVEINVLVADDLWPVCIDPGQLDQLLMNLALNARDAMPGHGRLTIALDNSSLPEGRGVLVAGDYVMLSVSDTGSGIPESTLAQVFEPFFTTKPEGKGTGLGLATCYAIAHQAGGDIRVTSQVGQGSTFSVWLPRAREDAALRHALAPQPRSLGGSETLLVVEDEPSVLAAVSRALEQHGYTVLQASNGEEALRLIDSGGAEVALVVTDAVMPQMSGPELVSHLSTRRPELPILMMTGYTDENALRHRILSGQAWILLKPFLPRDLVQRVRELLDTDSSECNR